MRDKLLIAFGTRPEYHKLKPLIDILVNDSTIDIHVLFTGQHTTLMPKDFICDESVIINPYAEHRLDNIILNCLSYWESLTEYPKYVMVQGDTTSAYAMALGAFHRHIPVIHLEAGLRTFDNANPFPEEFNRRSISVIAGVHLCPTTTDRDCLVSECITGKKHVVGNTVLDTIGQYKNNIKYEKKVLITMHRRENHDKLSEWFKAFNNLAEKESEYRFIFPMHHNPIVQKNKDIFSHVDVIEPLERDDFIKLLSECACVITDSGGVQEESTFLGKKVFSCRDPFSSERHDDHTTYTNPELLLEDFISDKNDFEKYKEIPCIYGDGHASERILKVLKEIW